MSKKDKAHVEGIFAKLVVNYSKITVERMQTGGLADASAANAPAAPAAAAVERRQEKIENILERAREEINKDRQGNILLAAHKSAREYRSFAGQPSQKT
eukprot:1545916-Alexandrium_andersonii.AAC.1